MHASNGGLVSLRMNGTLALATLWRVERADGTVLRFTDHDSQLEYAGETYTPGRSQTASARQGVEGVEPRNADVQGVFEDGGVTDADIEAGAYNGAVVTETVVDWRYPFAGAHLRNRYEIEELTWDGERWVAKMLGAKLRLQSAIGFQYTRTCRHTLGDQKCGVDLSSLEQSGTVASVDASGRELGTGLSSPDGYFDGGELLFTSGAASGKHAVVKSSLADGTVELQLAPAGVAAGDTFIATPGCAKTFETCDEKFGNGPRFGGFPYIPGTDEALSTPEVRPLS